MKILVTGGAGFIGSHVCDRLVKDGHAVVCVDDLSLGREENVQQLRGSGKFLFVKADVTDAKAMRKIFETNSFDACFHLAANSDIMVNDLNIDYRKTFLTTHVLLDFLKSYRVKQLIFTSTSAIYGEKAGALREDDGPLRPISFYGAFKLASEAIIAAHVHQHGLQAWVFRFPNVVGRRLTHGVIYDFMRKLTLRPSELEVLGDGKQEKPYLHVSELVDAMLFAWKKANGDSNVFNLGADSSTTVKSIAAMVVQEMGLKPKVRYTGGDRGWKGDVPKFAYDLSRIHALGWKAKMGSNDAVRLAIKEQLGKA